jgi:hypothetical protein
MHTAMETMKERWEKVQSAIARSAEKVGRRPGDIAVVAVTKGVSAERILEARAAGMSIVGENRVQEAEGKIPVIADPGLSWHMIGHLQTNKVKTALSLFQLIQSVDSVRLAKTLSDESFAMGKVTSVLLEVNISGEPQKYGFGTEEIYTAIDQMAGFDGIRIQGLMGIGPGTPDDESIRIAFKKLKGVFGACKSVKQPNVEMKWLSMGMSDDFHIAIEEGANMVRLGRALFGHR